MYSLQIHKQAIVLTTRGESKCTHFRMCHDYLPPRISGRDDVLPANYSIVHGACIDVGVGGFFLHGGANNGNMLRGWSNETIVEMDVILANGTLVRSLRHDDTAHAPLFRALRRSGSSFGVVTALTVQVFSVSP